MFISCQQSGNKYDYNYKALKDTAIADTSSISIEQIKPISYPDSGWVKKYYDDKWNLIYDTLQANYYRIAYYLGGKIVSDSITNDFYITGEKQFIGYIVSENPDVPNSQCTWFYKNGQPSKIVNFINGNVDGKIIEYYENGNFKTEAFVFESNYTGQYISYYENGIKEEERNYSTGELNGYNIKYYPSGTVKSKTYFANNEITGDYVEYYENGKYKSIGSYSNGNKTGVWSYLDEDGYTRQYRNVTYRVGAICMDGWRSHSTGRGTCSHHGGVAYWLVENEWRQIASGYFNESN